MLIPLAVVLLAVIVGVFWWAARSGQFDDLEGPAWRILMDDEQEPQASAQASTSRNEGKGRAAP